MVEVNCLSNESGTWSMLSGPQRVSRVPCVGELLLLGNDEHGRALEYKVLLVIHEADGTATTSADLCVERASLPDEMAAARR